MKVRISKENIAAAISDWYGIDQCPDFIELEALPIEEETAITVASQYGSRLTGNSPMTITSIAPKTEECCEQCKTGDAFGVCNQIPPCTCHKREARHYDGGPCDCFRPSKEEKPACNCQPHYVCVLHRPSHKIEPIEDKRAQDDDAYGIDVEARAKLNELIDEHNKEI